MPQSEQVPQIHPPASPSCRPRMRQRHRPLGKNMAVNGSVEDCTGAQGTWPPHVPRVAGPCVRFSPPNQQQPIEGTVEWSPKTRPRLGRPTMGNEGPHNPTQIVAHISQALPSEAPQQPTTEGGDGETKSSQGHIDGSWPEPQ